MFLSNDESVNMSKQRPIKSARRHLKRHTDADNDHLFVNMNEEELRQLLPPAQGDAIHFYSEGAAFETPDYVLGAWVSLRLQGAAWCLTQRQIFLSLEYFKSHSKELELKVQKFLKVSKQNQ